MLLGKDIFRVEKFSDIFRHPPANIRPFCLPPDKLTATAAGRWWSGSSIESLVWWLVLVQLTGSIWRRDFIRQCVHVVFMGGTTDIENVIVAAWTGRRRFNCCKGGGCILCNAVRPSVLSCKWLEFVAAERCTIVVMRCDNDYITVVVLPTGRCCHGLRGNWIEMPHPPHAPGSSYRHPVYGFLLCEKWTQ